MDYRLFKKNIFSLIQATRTICYKLYKLILKLIKKNHRHLDMLHMPVWDPLLRTKALYKSLGLKKAVYIIKYRSLLLIPLFQYIAKHMHFESTALRITK